MAWLSKIPLRGWLLIILIAGLAASAMNPANPADFAVEHSLTVAALVALYFLDRARPIANSAALCLFFFLCLHVLGAHYTYSFVPYDDWSRALRGRSINETFGWERNHYDRLVHLLFGLLMVVPMRELIVERFTSLRGLWSIGVSIAFLAMFSKMYELLEWIFAEVMSPEAAETYNGQQGDMFDAQKDMGLALLGSIVSGVFLALRDHHSASAGRAGPTECRSGSGGRPDSARS